MATKRPLALYDGEIEELRSADTLPGGGGGTQQVFVQQTRPTEPGPWMWWETDASGNLINLTVNDGA